jgi:hypothetical protein
MRRTNLMINMGLVFSLSLFVLGHFSASLAQSEPVLDLSKNKLRDRIQASGFITAKPIPYWGSIVGTKDGATNLTEGDILFLQFEPGKESKPGDRFSILRLGKAISHPVSQKELGQVVMVAGELIILDVKNQSAIAKISRSYHSITVGNLIAPPRPRLPATIPIRSLASIEGNIIATLEDVVGITEGEFVFIDRGSQDGVIVGDLLSIYQAESTIDKEIEKLPLRKVGEAVKQKEEFPLIKAGEGVVVDTQEETSTVFIKKSLQDIFVGDKVISGRK